jgi:hypothetical protein
MVLRWKELQRKRVHRNKERERSTKPDGTTSVHTIQKCDEASVLFADCGPGRKLVPAPPIEQRGSALAAENLIEEVARK